jgi:predicted enzyme related to lactoylglutathione lyase
MTTRTTKHSAGEPAWFDLATPDLAVAKAFYHQLFGWEYVQVGSDEMPYQYAQSQERNAAGIAPIRPPDSPQPSAWTVFFASDDAAADAARVQALGGQVIARPMTIGESGIMAVCADPTGPTFGLWQTINHIGFGVENEHGAAAWCEVNTWDATAARAFYGQLLNATPQTMEGADYYFVMQRGEAMLCGVLQMDHQWEGIPPHWMVYFGVDNTDAAIERAVAAGGKVQVPAFEMAYGRMAVLSDPAGAKFSIVQPPAA